MVVVYREVERRTCDTTATAIGEGYDCCVVQDSTNPTATLAIATKSGGARTVKSLVKKKTLKKVCHGIEDTH